MRRRNLALAEERRTLALNQARVEVRTDDDGAEHFVGHAAVFNSRATIGNPLRWGFYEEIADGAFAKTLSEGDARKLIDHDSYYVVSRVSAGTLELTEDKVGLAVDSALDTSLSYVNDLIANLRNGNITGMSFGFYVIKDEWLTETVELSNGDSAEVEVRIIKEVQLIEVSSVTFPAYEDTDAGLRHSLIPALRHRGDRAAVERRAQFLPELAELLDDMPVPAERSAIKPHSTDTDEKKWDKSKNVGNLPDDASAATLRKVYAWVDPDGDPKAKESYKFPHHFVDSNGAVGAASTQACTNGIAVLNGGRGGSGIPDADRKGVYNHLAKHLRDADIEPAELKSASEPGESTRTVDDTDHGSEHTEPAASTRGDHQLTIDDRMRALGHRYRLRSPV